MDHIRQALDRVREERKTSESAARAPLIGTRRAAASPGSREDGAGRYIYTRTRVFTPSAAILEANRILDPAATDPASAGFRMLRTQVLQRMNANGWRSL